MPRLWLPAALAALGLVLLSAGAVVWVQAPATSAAAVQAVQVGPGTSDYERGRALFVAKGCIGCHRHEQAGAPRGGSYGPNLSDIDKPYTLLHNDPEYLRLWLRDPSVKNPNRVMPDLDLSDEEIESLLAFLVPSRWTPNLDPHD